MLSYIADVLGDLGRCTAEEDTSFDAEQFCEMISAYVPEFTSIERLTGQQVDLMVRKYPPYILCWFNSSPCVHLLAQKLTVMVLDS